MKKTKTKLALDRETIRRIQLIATDQLAHVNGGQTVPTPTSRVSCEGCKSE